MMKLFITIPKVVLAYFELILTVDGTEIVIRRSSRRQAVRFRVSHNHKELKHMFDIAADTQQVFQIDPVDAKDKLAEVDGDITFSISPEGGATLFPQNGGRSLLIGWQSAMGPQTVTVKGDADLTTGVREIITTFQIQTLANEAVGFRVTPGAVTPL